MRNAKTATRRSRTNGTAADPTSERLAALRAQAASDPLAARDATWNWFREAGNRISSDRNTAVGELRTLFSAGSPSLGLDGHTEGMLVGWAMHPIFDRTMSTVTRAWLPWAGKRFNARAQTGDNLLFGNARWPSKVLWPRYALRRDSDRFTAFDFQTRVEPGALDPDTNVLVIDYAPVNNNPALIIKQIRDELVEVVPGANLGKMLWRSGADNDPNHTLLAYFALKSEPNPT
jgi:hypothetical protein